MARVETIGIDFFFFFAVAGLSKSSVLIHAGH